MNRGIMKLLIIIREKKIICRTDIVQEEFPEKMKLDLYTERHY